MTLGSPLLSAIPGLRHAFFTGDGGVSGGIYASLNGGIGSNDDPAHVAENRRRMAEQIGVAPTFSQRVPNSFAGCRGGHRAMAWRVAAARRRHRDPHRGSRHRRQRRRLRTDPAGRSEGARDRCGACGVEGRADGHPGIHHRCDGKTRRRTQRHGRRDRPLDPPAQLRSSAANSSSGSCRPMRRMRCFPSPPRAKATRCSILRVSSGCGSKTPAS